MRMRWLLIACVFLVAGCSRAVLFAELDERQANQVEGALLAANIDADKELSDNKKGWKVLVERDDFPQAVELLRAQGLPRPSFDSLGTVFKKEGFVSSPLEERARYLYALSQELEHTIATLDGVIAARVHIALPQHDALDPNPKSASASVVITARPGSPVLDYETKIKAIVKDSVEGLDDANKITVTFFTTGVDAPSSVPRTDASHSAALVMVPKMLRRYEPFLIGLVLAGLFMACAWWSRERWLPLLAQARTPRRD
ncbi:MAG: type III secretion inner membrane ring lipoprotein SctJ [Rudaea sp.]|uniref:type III secretion system inner membrane ring lipoprotein SctJ n=1 Tax=unclassified Rudaea TaxID=2627037 RepID=UPI0010F7884A|nr:MULTISPECIES: type III secretion inner membrane ring lipoprotein SctJ [unclassified Rudaea]MBN8887452.1 type III secretion inner membrane ring lipoprotein SctJ [Rudaea sp.]MBR0345094.1 type III secretion inner membrane ring lipoprotein SctJ [Rudaea sp.]